MDQRQTCLPDYILQMIVSRDTYLVKPLPCCLPMQGSKEEAKCTSKGGETMCGCMSEGCLGDASGDASGGCRSSYKEWGNEMHLTSFLTPNPRRSSSAYM